MSDLLIVILCQVLCLAGASLAAHDVVRYSPQYREYLWPVYQTYLELSLPDRPTVGDFREALVKQSGKSFVAPEYFFERMLELPKNSDRCPRLMVLYSLTILAIPQMKGLWHYVDQAAPRVQRCAERLSLGDIEEQLKRNHMHLDFFNSLEEFYHGALDHDLTDGYLERLQELDLAKDSVNTLRMMEAIKDKHLDFVSLRPGQEITIELFLIDRCLGLKRAFPDQLNLLNLGLAIGRVHFEKKLLEINEYNRICIEWRNLTLRRAMLKNLKQQQKMNSRILSNESS